MSAIKKQLKENLGIALVQYDIIWENVEANLHKLDQMLEKYQQDVDIFVLPEMFVTGFTMTPENVLDKDSNEKVLNWLQQKSNQKNALFMGSMVFNMDSTLPCNRFFAIYPNNGTPFFYDKSKPFVPAGEDKKYTQYLTHNKFQYNDTINFGGLVCFDLRFPGLSLNLVPDSHSYDVLFCVANWPQKRILQWERLLRARAIENQAFVIGVNRVGNDNNGIYHNGASMALDFMGDTIADLYDAEGIINVNLDLKALATWRSSFIMTQNLTQKEIWM